MDEEKSLPESSTVSINSDQWQQLSPDNNSSPENVTDNSDNDNDTVNLSTNIPENLVFTNHTDIVRDVIVVGAGISGLSAAKLLYESGFDVLVLEARERVGGRTYTKRDPKVDYVDLGGAYVGPGQNRVLRLIHELGLQTYKVNEKEYLLHYRDGKTMRFNRDKLPYGRSLLEKLDQNNFFRLIDKMGEQIPANEPWNAPNAKQWDTITFQQFVERNVWTKGVKSLAKTIIACFVANEAYESSLLWFLWYIKQCGGLTPILSTTDGAQERKIIGGSMQISEKIADKMGNERVLLNKPIVGIRYDNDTKISCVQTLDGAQYKARHVILALAPPMQMRIHFTPSLPPLRNQLMQRCPMGSAIKSIVYYEKPFWREKGFCGSMFLEGKDDDSDCVTLSFTFDDTKYDGKNPAIVGFIVADIARRMSTLTKEERLRRICKSFSIALNTDEALRPIHYEEHIWMGEQYSGGCYTIACPPGFLTQFGRLMREPINNIHFAGTETATFCSGYMEGGIEAGERAAREILHVRGYISKDEIWQLEPPSKIVPPVGEHRPTFWERNAPSVGDLFKYMGLTLFGGLIVAHVVTVHKIGAFKFECPIFQHLNMNGVTSVFRKP